MPAGPTITLKIEPVTYLEDCYRVSYVADLQPGQKVYLEVEARFKMRFEITNGFGRAHVAALLEAFATYGAWGTTASCRALLVDSQTGNQYVDTLVIENEALGYDANLRWTMLGLNILATSNTVSVRTPVEPIAPGYTCRYGRDLLLAIGRAIPSPPYVWEYGPDGSDPDTDPDVVGIGRTLTPPIQRRYYFINSNNRTKHFETDTTKRGFDCTSYILAAFDVQGRYNFGDGSEVATLINANAVCVENETGARLSTYFNNMPSSANGMFAVWIPGKHIVMLIDGSIYEYTTGGVFGFAQTPVVNWFNARKTKKFNIRALPGTRTFTLPPQDAQVQIGVPGGGGVGSTPGSSLPPTNGNGGGGSSYTVVSGDSLSLISGRFWKDVLLWPILYDANRSVVGPDPNKIYPGQKLTVPDISGYSASQLSSARSRGRNC